MDFSMLWGGLLIMCVCVGLIMTRQPRKPPVYNHTMLVIKALDHTSIFSIETNNNLVMSRQLWSKALSEKELKFIFEETKNQAEDKLKLYVDDATGKKEVSE